LKAKRGNAEAIPEKGWAGEKRGGGAWGKKEKSRKRETRDWNLLNLIGKPLGNSQREETIRLKEEEGVRNREKNQYKPGKNGLKSGSGRVSTERACGSRLKDLDLNCENPRIQRTSREIAGKSGAREGVEGRGEAISTSSHQKEIVGGGERRQSRG